MPRITAEVPPFPILNTRQLRGAYGRNAQKGHQGQDTTVAPKSIHHASCSSEELESIAARQRVQS